MSGDGDTRAGDHLEAGVGEEHWPNSWKSVSTYGSAPHAAATLLMEMKDSAALREKGRSVAMTHYA